MLRLRYGGLELVAAEALRQFAGHGVNGVALRDPPVLERPAGEQHWA
jgi:hypothetical protein